MGKLLSLATAKSAAAQSDVEYETFKAIVIAMIPMPSSDRYQKVDADGKTVIVMKSSIPAGEEKDYVFLWKAFLVKYRPIDDNGNVLPAITGFVTENQIDNPVTVWDDIKCSITMNSFTTKSGEESAGISRLSVSFNNIEHQIKNVKSLYMQA